MKLGRTTILGTAAFIGALAGLTTIRGGGPC
jgi:hypothetical protein